MRAAHEAVASTSSAANRFNDDGVELNENDTLERAHRAAAAAGPRLVCVSATISGAARGAVS